MPKRSREQRIVTWLKKELVIPKRIPDSVLVPSLQAFLNPPVASIQFSDVKGNHLTRDFGLTLTNVWNPLSSKWKMPEDVRKITPRPAFDAIVASMANCFVFDCDSVRRTLIDVVLMDVMNNDEFQNNVPMRCWGNISIGWQSKHAEFVGKVDYAIRCAPCWDNPPAQDIYLIPVQSKMGWYSSYINQAIAQGATLQKKRKAVGKTAVVYIMLSDGFIWQFFNIGEDGHVQASRIMVMDLTSHPEDVEARQQVFTWIGHLMRQARIVALADVATVNDNDEECDEGETAHEDSDWDENTFM